MEVLQTVQGCLW